MSISDEAVEAAADRMQQFCLAHDRDGVQPWTTYARAALEAAAPYIAAAALREAADAFENLPVNKGAEISSGTWDWFELFPIAHLRERADRLTQRRE